MADSQNTRALLKAIIAGTGQGTVDDFERLCMRSDISHCDNGQSRSADTDDELGTNRQSARYVYDR